MSGLEEKFVHRAFESNWIAPLGPEVDALEQEICSKFNIKSATMLSSGTAGLHLALKLVGVKDGDYVICSSLTFAGGAFPILYERANPVFVDSDLETWNMNPDALEIAILETKKRHKLPKAVIVTNLYGQSDDYDPILEICNDYKIPVIEDAAESIGATYKGKYSGTIGLIGIYSFNGNKIITTGGGGALVSNNEELVKKAKFLATQAKEKSLYYQHTQIGYNYRMSNISAAIGRGQLRVLEERVKARRTVFSRYYDALSGIYGISFMPEADYGKSNRWLTALTIDSQELKITRTDIINELSKWNIESRPVWKPMHLQPVFNNSLYFSKEKNRSISDKLYENGICLPSGSSLTIDQQDQIIDIIYKKIRK